MGTSDFSPNGTGLGTVDGLLGAVDEGDTFTQVGTSFSLGGNVFEFENRSGRGLSVLSATVSHVTSLNEESKLVEIEIERDREGWGWGYKRKRRLDNVHYKQV